MKQYQNTLENETNFALFVVLIIGWVMVISLHEKITQLDGILAMMETVIRSVGVAISITVALNLGNTLIGT